MKQLVIVTTIFTLFSSSLFGQDACVQLFSELRDRYKLRNQTELYKFTREFLSLDKEVLQGKTSAKRSSFSASSFYQGAKFLLGNDNSANYNSDYTLRLKEEYEREGALSDKNYLDFTADVLNIDVARIALECVGKAYDSQVAMRELDVQAKKDELDAMIRLKEIEIDKAKYEELQRQGVTIGISGSTEFDFLITISWTPLNFLVKSVKVNQINKSEGLQWVGKEQSGMHRLWPGSEVSFHVKRVTNRPLWFSANLEGLPVPIKLDFAALGGSALPVGTVVPSMLTFSQYNYEIMGTANELFNPVSSKWAPADGRSVEGSDYSQYHKFVPDLRGQFLRGYNVFDQARVTDYKNGIDELEDERTLINEYSYQDDYQKKHVHNLRVSGTAASNGSHSHDAAGKHRHGLNRNLLKYEGHSQGQSGTNNYHGKKSGANHETGENGDHSHGAAGNHTHSVSVSGNTNDTGAAENTVKNVAVRYYIKINN